MDANIKPVVAVVVAIIGALVTALGTGATDISDVDLQTWLIAAGSVLASGALVWWTENGPYAPTIKAIMSFLSAGIASLVIALDDRHISQAEWLTALSVAIVASGLVYQTPGPMHTETAPQTNG